MLRELGAETIDADEVARAVLQPGTPGLTQLVATFGEQIMSAEGLLDRKRLGAMVFNDPAARAKLNAITHPLIAAETARRVASLAARGVGLVFYEAALLVETAAHRGFAGLIVVEADPRQQRERVASRDGLSAEEIEGRLSAQISNEARRAAADLVLRNDGTLETLRRGVESMYAGLSTGTPLSVLAHTL